MGFAALYPSYKLRAAGCGDAADERDAGTDRGDHGEAGAGLRDLAEPGSVNGTRQRAPGGMAVRLSFLRAEGGVRSYALPF